MRSILLSLRTLMRFRAYTLINIASLALSLTCALTILRYVHQEVTVDHHFTDWENTYIIIEKYANKKPVVYSDENCNNVPDHPNLLADPAVIKYSRFHPLGNTSVELDNQLFIFSAITTDSVFFQLAHYPLLEGSNKLATPESVILTKETARKLFPDGDAIGKTLRAMERTLTITGIIDKAEYKSSLQFDIVFSNNLKRSWSVMSKDLVLLTPNADIDAINSKYDTPFKTYSSTDRAIQIQFYPLKKFYFDTHIEFYPDEMILRGNKDNVYILCIAAGLLLLIGVFNFINVYTVIMLRRTREFGIRKIYGAGRSNIFTCIYAENMIMVIIALLLSWLFLEITGKLMQLHLGIPELSNIHFDFGISLAIGLLLPLITTLYPFLRYTRATPITSLQSVYMKGSGSSVSRTSFLFIQYIITFGLVTVSLFFSKQLHFMLQQDLGFRSENIIRCQMRTQARSYDITDEESWKNNKRKIESARENITRCMNESPLFTHWTGAEDTPHQMRQKSFSIKFTNGTNEAHIHCNYASARYFPLFNLQLKEGRFFNDSIEHSRGYFAIANETACQMLGVTDIETDLIQPEFRLWWSSEIDNWEEEMKKNPPYRIVGVIKDFKTGHLAMPTPPIVYLYTSPGIDKEYKFFASFPSGHRKKVLDFLLQLQGESGEGDLQYSFIEDEIAAQYAEDRRTVNIYTTFSIIAILISCFGLLGLSLFDIQQRFREIALRKVNGATLRDILILFMKKYIYILAGAFVVATPLSYWVIAKYLEGFAHKAPISADLFLIAAGITTLISIGTLYWQIRKAAQINPIEAIKKE